MSQRQKNKMLGVWLSREDHDKLEQFVGQFAVDENACVVPEKGARFMGTETYYCIVALNWEGLNSQVRLEY